MTSRPVAVLDSGIGGLPYLSWLQSHLPHESLVYVADAAHFPYGEKSPQDVRRIVTRLGQDLVSRFDPKLLLVACNTASVLGLESLRASLKIPVVGVVPAVKTAAALGSKTLAVLATPRTVENDYWENLGRTFAPGRTVKGYAAPDLVKLVEEGGERTPPLRRWAQRLLDDGVDAVVLGCTHYLHLEEELSRLLGPSVAVVDSRDGVGRRVAQVLGEHRLLAEQKQQPDRFLFTADPRWDLEHKSALHERYRRWSREFKLEYLGPWEVTP